MRQLSNDTHFLVQNPNTLKNNMFYFVVTFLFKGFHFEIYYVN